MAYRDDRFLRAKIATAHFFGTQLLPRGTALAPSVLAGADDLFEVDPELFKG